MCHTTEFTKGRGHRAVRKNRNRELSPGSGYGIDYGGTIYNDETVTLSISMVFGNQPDDCYDVPDC
jgi:hypothetical protein